ncbi:bacillithiol system protein YtxJ [Anoxybacillus thermarum]|uniref:Bacillithiol system protein YtxJ n=1 Tax=Anoxybacillus thermarum TaxID=404937 RepID=A0A0D0RYE0_9BACL|nr:bacillithiol system redox-active protein YtxJ [Anoxybacillus thermarum]KIQ93711.1 bacillithiol system protein YtxJ [Anoxybacillus thermarum]
MEKVETIEQFEQICLSHRPFLFMKHSLTCPISHRAWGEFERFTNDFPHIRAYYLHVQHARPLSQHIAQAFQVKHESPQVLWVTEQGVEWHASHWNVTYEQMKKATMSTS